MYSWQHCGTGTLSYRQPRYLVIMDHWNGQQRAFATKMSIKLFCWISSIFVGFFQKLPFFLCHSVEYVIFYVMLTVHLVVILGK
jgi:hypothetical protein